MFFGVVPRLGKVNLRGVKIRQGNLDIRNVFWRGAKIRQGRFEVSRIGKVIWR